VLDRAYAIWLPLMFLFPAVAVMAVEDVRIRTRLLGCWLVSWVVIGSIGAWAFGSAGPCYYNALVGPHPGFAALHQQLAHLAAQAQAQSQVIAAIDFQSMLLNEHKGAQFVSAGGISAMPSMHVAMATLFAIGGFRVSRPFGWVMTIYAVMIWIASIHLGWHYAIDGIAGASMMAGLWLLSGKIVGRRANPLSPDTDTV
jgi:membrane-associated phospholipid phosphatase